MQLRESIFHMMPPVVVTETEILTGIPDAQNQVYSTGDRPYAAGAYVWDGGHVFLSLVDGNNAATSDAASWQDLGEVDQGAAAWSGSASENQLVVSGGGLWKSTINSNTVTPALDSNNWQYMRATFRSSPFDDVFQDTASLAGPIKYTLQTTELVTHIAVLRASGDQLSVKMTDAVDGVIYNETFSLIDDSNVRDAWEYCFNPIMYRDEFVVGPMPPYAGAEIEIEITGEASVAQILIGHSQPHGIALVGSAAGFEAYDKIERGEFNRAKIVERSYSDTAGFILRIPKGSVGYFKREFAKRRAKPTLYYVPGFEHMGMITYGLFKGLNPISIGRVSATCTLDTEGLG